MRKLKNLFLLCELTEVMKEILALLRERGTLRFGLALTLPQGTQQMIRLDPVSSFSNLKTVVLVNPTKPDGSPDEAAVVTCTSSDESQVGCEPNPEGGFFVTTPLESGAGTVTIAASSPNTQYDSVQFDFSYTPFVPGQINVSIGAQVPDSA